MARDFYGQPEAADPVLDSDTVLAIVRRHAHAAKAVVAVDELGGEARTYAIDDDLILKVQRPQRARLRRPLSHRRHRSVEGSRQAAATQGGRIMKWVTRERPKVDRGRPGRVTAAGRIHPGAGSGLSIWDGDIRRPRRA